MIIPPEPPRLFVSHDKDLHWLVALEYGRVGEDQPQGCWHVVSETCAYLLDAPEGRVVGFRINDFPEFDPDDPEVAAIWDDPRFDAPTLGLTNATAGEIVIAARRHFGDRDSLNRIIFGMATGCEGEEALGHWTRCLEAGDAMAHYALGYTLLGLGRPTEAYAHLRHYTEIAPEGAWNWCFYGQAAEAVGEVTEARRAYRRAIELDEPDEDGDIETDAPERLATLEERLAEAAKAAAVEAAAVEAARSAATEEAARVAATSEAASRTASAGEAARLTATSDADAIVDDGEEGDGLSPGPGDVRDVILPDGRAIAVRSHIDDAPGRGIESGIVLDGRTLVDLGRRRLEALDRDVAAGSTRGARPKSYAATDPNEDSVRVFRAQGATVLLVADGHNGESSSRIACDVLAETLATDPDGIDSDEGLVELLHIVNEQVIERTALIDQPESRTTLALAVVRGDRVRWASMGDSLVAIADPDGTVRRLGTPRHRFLGWPMDEDDVRAAVDRGHETLAKDGWLVLASDGLTDFVDDPAGAIRDAAMFAILAGHAADRDLQDALRPTAMRLVDDLIDTACDGGAGDNVAVVALRGTVETAEDAGRLRSTHPVDLDPADRFRGCLLGGAIGDALGAGIEHDSLRRISRRFGPDGLVDPAPAYGRDSAITDDTQMTLFTAEALLRTFTRAAERGVPGDAVWQLDQAYARWLRTQGERSLRWPNPGDLSTVERLLAGPDARRGPGRTCIAAMRGSVAGTPDEPTNSSKGCGGVMRVAPVGLMVEDLDDAMGLAHRAAALTHGHPTGRYAAGAFAGLIALLRGGAPLSIAVAVVAEELGYAEGADETCEALIRARGLLGEAIAPSAELVQSLGEGWVADEALAIGVSCALLARDFEHGVLLAVNHGGDSDSTGAIAGALLGMMFGADAIPERWLNDLEHATEIAEIADDLHAAASEDGDPDVLGEWWQARWPAE